jgi:ubiquinone biosynthesis protein UbiJ
MLFEIVELACNKALEHDAESQQRLQQLNGKRVLLRIKNLNQDVLVHPLAHGIEITPYANETPDVTLAATPQALLTILRSGLDRAELEPGELEISGDPIVAQRFARIAADLNIDWESLLEEHIGEIPAAFIATGLRKASELGAQGSALARQKINDSINRGEGWVAAEQDAEQFMADVDELRAAVDRLDVRLKRIQSKIQTD